MYTDLVGSFECGEICEILWIAGPKLMRKVSGLGSHRAITIRSTLSGDINISSGPRA